MSDELLIHWNAIGTRLGIETHFLEHTYSTNQQRLKHVLDAWLSNAYGLPHCDEYPTTWKGLCNLLESIGERNLAERYLNFLNRV